ncbi:uncharacterized protein LOC131936550 [Physella acuta]|uniref:uncharacterized protein LOC131936550 n=1 Tax=Physella acuta TaxID=109671 RepID=UPI0027DD780E|nr:uncharacterized protein LOC131936550 [Physella acuta]
MAFSQKEEERRKHIFNFFSLSSDKSVMAPSKVSSKNKAARSKLRRRRQTAKATEALRRKREESMTVAQSPSHSDSPLLTQDMAPTKKRNKQLKRARAARYQPKVEQADTGKNSTVDADLSMACGRRNPNLALLNTSSAPTPQESYFLIHESFMRSLLSEVACTDCGNNDLELSTTNSCGLAAQLKIYCSRCANEWEGWTSPPVDKHYDINHRAVLGCRDSNMEYLQLKSFLTSMNVQPQMHPNTFYTNAKTLGAEAQDTAEDVLCKPSSIVAECAADTGLQL